MKLLVNVAVVFVFAFPCLAQGTRPVPRSLHEAEQATDAQRIAFHLPLHLRAAETQSNSKGRQMTWHTLPV